MRAAVIQERGATPVVRDFAEPQASGDDLLVDVEVAGLGGWDVVGAYRLPTGYPCVIRGEGIGRTRDGRRVYFGERSVRPFGAVAERTVVPAAEVWDVPDGVDDATAITMGIAGTGALVPLEQAAIRPGESVLVLGGTGTLGQLALQLARVLGAGRVVAAARGRDGLDRVLERGIADAAVQLGGADVATDAAALRAAAGEGFDVVLDMVYGAPFLAALKATRWGSRIVTIGTLAGATAEVPAGDLLFRTHGTVGTGQRSPEDRHAIWLRLLGLARDAELAVDLVRYPLERAGEAWAQQAASPHAKVLLDVRG
jgi:NADPH:quinone reductase-like Zn-dependent oxidoreductase